MAPNAGGIALHCAACGREFGERAPVTRCPCGGLLDARVDVPYTAATLRARWDRSPTTPTDATSGVWRFRELVHPAATDAEIVSWPEGNTPLLTLEALAAFVRHDPVWIKHEGMNPTGSFKDRGMTVAVTQAKRIGARAVGCASTGNTSASLAAYAARAGLRAIVVMPAGHVTRGKIAQAIAHGATCVQIDGDFDAALRLIDEAASDLGIYLANSINPFRLQGQKSIVFELLAQRDWRPPDWIVLPAGNLGNTSAFGAALADAHRAGLIDRLPRLVSVQAAGAAPFAAAFADGFRTRHRVAAETRATAIRIGDPASWDRGVEAIRLTNGIVLSVTDAEILAAKRAIDRAGVGCESASAASLAGIRELVRQGKVRPGEEVVAVLTGHLLKDTDAIASDDDHIRIPPTRQALKSVLDMSA